MSVLIEADTRVICQGITGRQGSFHTQESLDYGTRVVGGVTPGRGGDEAGMAASAYEAGCSGASMLCGEGAEQGSLFIRCLRAINCKMKREMRR